MCLPTLSRVVASGPPIVFLMPGGRRFSPNIESDEERCLPVFSICIYFTIAFITISSLFVFLPPGSSPEGLYARDSHYFSNTLNYNCSFVAEPGQLINHLCNFIMNSPTPPVSGSSSEGRGACV